MTQRWSDSRDLIYTSQIQEMSQCTRMPIHLFILRFHCQAVSFQLVIVLVFQKESKLRRQDKNRRSFGNRGFGIVGPEWPPESTANSERLFYPFCTGTVFLARQSTLSLRQLEETKPSIIYYLVFLSILHLTWIDWTSLSLNALLPPNFYALLKSPSPYRHVSVVTR